MTAKFPQTKKLLLPSTFLAALLLGYYLGAYQYSLLFMGKEFALTGAQFGLLAGINFGAMCILPVVFGVLADKHSKKPILLISSALLLCALLLFRPVDSFGTLLLAAFLAGSGFGSIEALYISVISDAYPPGKITGYANLSQSLFSAGAFAAPLLSSAAMGAGAGWRQLFLPVILALCVLIPVYLFARMEKKPAEGSAARSGKPKSMLKSPLLYILLAWIFLYVGAETVTGSFSNNYMTLHLAAPDSAALALSLFWVMMIPSRLLAGLIKKNHIRLVAVFAALLAASACVIALTGNPTVALVCFALCGFFCGPIWPTIFAFGQQAFPHKTGTIGSLCIALGGLGGFLLPLLCGVLSESVSLPAVFFAIGVSALGVLALTLAARRFMKKTAQARSESGK